MGGRSQQRAIRIVAAIRGPNKRTRPGAVTSLTEGDADMRVEKHQRPGKEVAGSHHEPGVARQACSSGKCA